MAVCGLPIPNEKHAEVLINFARGIYKDLEEANKTSKLQFNLRIGINSGDVIAGVIGKTKFIYDLWGDTVNVASRMEAACDVGEILVSDTTWELTKNTVEYSSNIEIDVKGKGLMMAHYVSQTAEFIEIYTNNDNEFIITTENDD